MEKSDYLRPLDERVGAGALTVFGAIAVWNTFTAGMAELQATILSDPERIVSLEQEADENWATAVDCYKLAIIGTLFMVRSYIFDERPNEFNIPPRQSK